MSVSFPSAMIFRSDTQIATFAVYGRWYAFRQIKMRDFFVRYVFKLKCGEILEHFTNTEFCLSNAFRFAEASHAWWAN